MPANNERFLVLGALRNIAQDLFAASRTTEGCRALWILGELLDRRDVPRSAVKEIRALSALAAGPQEWR